MAAEEALIQAFHGDKTPEEQKAMKGRGQPLKYVITQAKKPQRIEEDEPRREQANLWQAMQQRIRMIKAMLKKGKAKPEDYRQAQQATKELAEKIEKERKKQQQGKKDSSTACMKGLSADQQEKQEQRQRQEESDE